MYTVDPSHLPGEEAITQTDELMRQALAHAMFTRTILGLRFEGIVYMDNPSDTESLRVLGYTGLVTSMVDDPAGFNLLVGEAWLQVEECDCTDVDVDCTFADTVLTQEAKDLIRQLGEFAGVATQCPHFEAIPLPPNSEVTIPFNRLGACCVTAVFWK